MVLALAGATVRAKRLRLSPLVIGATHDTMDPDHMRWMADTVADGTYLHCPDGSHLAIYDDQQTFFRGLLEFLTRPAEGRRGA